MDYNVDNIEGKSPIVPTANTDVVLHNNGKFQRAKIFGTDGKIKPQFVTQTANYNTYELDPDQIVPSEALYTDDTLAGDVLKRVDKITGVDVNYREVTIWHDGTVMNDTKVDGVVYLKKETKYYKRQFDGIAKSSWFANPFQAFSFLNEIEIDNEVDLNGNTFTFPINSSIVFNGGGIKNGILEGTNTVIKGANANVFNNVQFNGTFDISYVSEDYFTGYANDTELLKAIFDLGFEGKNKCDIYLGTKTYNIYAPKSGVFEYSICKYTNSANKRIIQSGALINDTRNYTEFDALATYDGILGFLDSQNIEINLDYINASSDWTLATDIGIKGVSFIRTHGDCSEFVINSKITGARYGIKSGEYSKHWLNGLKGLINSRINITAERCGYPIAVELGDNLNLSIDSATHHRAAYLCGVSNVKGVVKTKDNYLAPFHVLLSDTQYSNNEVDTFYKAFSNIDLTIEDTGSTVGNTSTYLFGWQLYGFTRPALRFNNINIRVIKNVSTIVGTVKLINSSTDEIADTYDSVNINVVDKTEYTTGFGAFIQQTQFKNYNNVFFSINSPDSNLFIDSTNTDFVNIVDSRVKNLYNIAQSSLRNSAVLGGVIKPSSNIGATVSRLRVRNSQLPYMSNTVFDSIDSDTQSYKAYNATMIAGVTGKPSMSWDEDEKMYRFWDGSGWKYVKAYKTQRTSGTTAQRPTPNASDVGFPYFDITLGKGIHWNGSSWITNQAVSDSDSTATDVAGLVTDFNDLLAKLRTAGIIAP